MNNVGSDQNIFGFPNDECTSKAFQLKKKKKM